MTASGGVHHNGLRWDQGLGLLMAETVTRCYLILLRFVRNGQAIFEVDIESPVPCLCHHYGPQILPSVYTCA